MSDCNHKCNDCHENCDERELTFKPHHMSSIKKVIAIASGKGGVGKSLVTSLMAVLLNRKGYNTAILDADITGPSIPKVFGVNDKIMGNDEGLVPNSSKTGIKIMSSNLMLKENTDPIVWRGPIIANLVKQFWTDVIWQDIDFMFVDMPPGTGDVPLTVFQSLNVDGIIIVTSPQELVSMIVSKAVKMAKMMNIPVLGLVENMSYLECDECNHQIKLFGESHVDEVAKEYGLNVLAKMPLDPKIAGLCDKGKVEDVQTNHLDNAVLMLEDLPINVLTVAVPILDGKVDPHLGKATKFHVYQVVKNMVINGYRFEIEEAGINSVIEKLKENEVSVVMVTQMGEHIMKAMTKNGISVVTKASGDPLAALHKFLGNELLITTISNCDCGGHHEEEHEHEHNHEHEDENCGCGNHDGDSECGCGNHDDAECGCGNHDDAECGCGHKH